MSMDEKNTQIYVGFEGEEPYDPATPEKNLLRAVLMSALNDLGKQGDVGRKATEFFLSREENYLFSFRSICDYLSVDPKRILRVTGISPLKLKPQEIAERLGARHEDLSPKSQ